MNNYKKIAVISDIHGNLEALKAVLSDISRRNADKIICLGDIIAKGSHPSECIKLVRENCDEVLVGNCDRYFTEEFVMSELGKTERKRILWNKSMLSEEDVEYLRSLPFSYEFYLSGSLIRMFHATPLWDNVAVDMSHDFETKYNMFVGNHRTITEDTADIVVYGHIHHCFLERFYNRTLINAGSVGNSHEIIRNEKRDADDIETTQAVYLILEGDYGKREPAPISWQFVRVPYDIEEELKNSKYNVEYKEYASELLYGKYRNMDKVYKNLKKVGVDTNKI